MEAVFIWAKVSSLRTLLHLMPLGIRRTVEVEPHLCVFRFVFPSILHSSMFQGAKFQDALAAADTFEGSLIRALRRLDELLHEVGTACRAIGETNMANKMDESSNLIKRGVPFAPSLYL